MTIRYSEGGVTVDLGGQLEAFVADVLARTEGAVVREIRAEAETLAALARSRWYGPEGVERVTGLSGDIRVVQTIDASKGEIRISIGSTDKRLAGPKPLPVFVKRPGRFAVDLVPVTPAEWYATPKSMRGAWLPTIPKTPQVFRPSPRASDGKAILNEFVKKPGRALAKAMAGRLAEQIGAANG